jgi:hypothetical protein
VFSCCHYVGLEDVRLVDVSGKERLLALTLGSDFADVVERTASGHAVHVLLAGFVLDKRLDCDLHLFRDVELHHFLAGLKLSEHVVVGRILLMRATQSVGLLP